MDQYSQLIWPGIGILFTIIIAVVISAKYFIFPFFAAKRKAKLRQSMEKQKKDIVYLYGFKKTSYGLTVSPSVTKVETFLRLATIPYEYIEAMPNISPSERLPFITYNGKIVCESQFIIRYLFDTFPKQTATLRDDDNNEAEVGKGHMVRRLVENSLADFNRRVMMVDNMQVIRPLFAKVMKLNPIMAAFMGRMMRKNTIRLLNMTGMGDLSQQEYHEEYLLDVKTLVNALGSEGFLMGAKPTMYDCVVFSTLFVMFWVDTEGGQIEEMAFNYLRTNSRVKEYMLMMGKAASFQLEGLFLQH